MKIMKSKSEVGGEAVLLKTRALITYFKWDPTSSFLDQLPESWHPCLILTGRRLKNTCMDIWRQPGQRPPALYASHQLTQWGALRDPGIIQAHRVHSQLIPTLHTNVNKQGRASSSMKDDKKKLQSGPLKNRKKKKKRKTLRKTR